MTLKEINNKIEELKAEIASNPNLNFKAKKKLTNALHYYSTLEKRALSYNDAIKDPETAVELYSTKQMGLFLALSEQVCRRIRKGYYANKQKYLIADLNSNEIDKKRLALGILRFDIDKFIDIHLENIKFEIIIQELSKGFWSF